MRISRRPFSLLLIYVLLAVSISAAHAALNLNIAGPANVVKSGTSVTYVVTPIGAITDTYTPNDGGAGGTFTPSALTFLGLRND